MLPISRLSTIEVNSDEWKKAKLGKISSSLVGNLIGKKSNMGEFTDGAISYLQNLAGEVVTGMPAKEEFFTSDTNWGNAHEAEAIAWFEQKTEWVLFRDEDTGKTHKLIRYDEWSGSTPDALICITPDNPLSKDETKLKCMPLEVKCPATYHSFIKLYSCITPQDLKECHKLYYWQVIDQILNTDSFIKGGMFCVYHPYFPTKGRIIHFDFSLIEEDFTFLVETKKHAKKKLKELIDYLK